jgi:hypothetical protein
LVAEAEAVGPLGRVRLQAVEERGEPLGLHLLGPPFFIRAQEERC